MTVRISNILPMDQTWRRGDLKMASLPLGFLADGILRGHVLNFHKCSIDGSGKCNANMNWSRNG